MSGRLIPAQNQGIFLKFQWTTFLSDCGCVMRSELVMVTPSKVSYLMLRNPRGEMAAAKACNSLCESGMGYSIIFPMSCTMKKFDKLQGALVKTQNMSDSTNTILGLAASWVRGIIGCFRHIVIRKIDRGSNPGLVRDIRKYATIPLTQVATRSM